MSDSDFHHGSSFEPAEASGQLELDRYETTYQQLFSQALEDGVITAEERSRLDKAAESLGLDKHRLGALENALENAYKSHHGVAPLHTSRMFKALESIMPPPVDVPIVEGEVEQAPQRTFDELTALRARVRFLEERVRQLESELTTTKQLASAEVDFSDLEAPVPSMTLEEPAALHRRLRHDPRDADTLHTLVHVHAGDLDRQWCAAQATVYVGHANDFEKQLVSAHRPSGLIAPTAAVDATAWQRWLYHPDDEVVTSDILSIIVSAVLLAHSATLRENNKLPQLRGEQRLDPQTTTVAAARCFGWAAQTLGMEAPPLFVAPDADVAAEMVPTVPPSCVLGKRLLAGRSPLELAFLAGRELAFFRRERFIRLVVPEVPDLEDLFLAALLIANPALPLHAKVRTRVQPIASAIEPLLEPKEIDRLRAAYQRFVETGGRTNLARWARAADLTAVRAGFLLSGDLGVAHRMLELLEDPLLSETMDDLIVFATSDRYAKLRSHMGIALQKE